MSQTWLKHPGILSVRDGKLRYRDEIILCLLVKKNILFEVTAWQLSSTNAGLLPIKISKLLNTDSQISTWPNLSRDPRRIIFNWTFIARFSSQVIGRYRDKTDITFLWQIHNNGGVIQQFAAENKPIIRRPSSKAGSWPPGYQDLKPLVR